MLLLGCQKDTPDAETIAKPKYTLTIAAQNGGTVSTEGGTYDAGTEVTLSATPNSGYQFLRWEGIDATESSITLTVDADLTITAIFIDTAIALTLESELPLFHITTAVQIENEPKVPGNLKIYQQGELLVEHPIGIEYRGSTSYRLSDKKSYGFETWDENNQDVNISLLGFPEEEDWILTGHVFRANDNRIFDPTLMKHYVGYSLFRSMGNYASRCKFVELSVNGDYLGVYVFMEKLKRDKNRIDIKKLKPDENDAENITGGYILKIDKTAGGDVASNQPLPYYDNNWEDDARYNEMISFRSSYGTDKSVLNFAPFGPPYHSQQYLETYFLYEYPKADDISPEQKSYIQNYIYEFETALLNDDFSSQNRTYTNYIDLASFVDYFILNELVGNIDAYRLSTYMYKNLGGKLKMGPVWDLNIGYGDSRIPLDDWIINYNTHVPQDPWLVPFWWGRLMEDPQFIATLKNRWTSLRTNALSTNNVVALVQNTSNYLLTNGAIQRNYDRWTGIAVAYETEVTKMIDYLRNRLAWMDTMIASM